MNSYNFILWRLGGITTQFGLDTFVVNRLDRISSCGQESEESRNQDLEEEQYMREKEHDPQITPAHIMQLAWGYAPPLIIEAAIHNRIFDALDGGAKTIDQISSETGTSARCLYALMNALTGFELVVKDQDSRYTLAPESSAFLVSTKPSFLGGLFRHISTDLLPKWLKLKEVIHTGSPSTDINRKNIDLFQQQVEDLYAMSYPAAQTLAEVLGIRTTERDINVLDLEAGSGVLSVTLAQASPHVHVTAIDWPDVIPVTRRVAERYGVADRFRFIEGDLIKSDFGTGYHIVTLGHILHSETDEWSLVLLKKTFDALVPGGTIAIVETFTNEDRTGPLYALILAVQMLTYEGRGEVLSLGEINRRLKRAGFQEIRTVETPSPFPIILARKP